MAYEKYNIKQFMDARFDGDRTVMNDEEYGKVYSEYIDTAELYETDEFNKVTYIHSLNNRINSIKMGIILQKRFIEEFGIPYIPGFAMFKKKGYILHWKDDIAMFLTYLDGIADKEKMYISKVEVELKQLSDMRAKKNKGEYTTKEKRGSFILTLNSLGKIGYNVDKEKTTVEELSYMIKQQKEDNKH